MTTKLQPVRGTKDIFLKEHDKFNFVTNTAYNLAKKYGFSQISTPIFEFTEVFKRTLGDASDIVNKEMYSFNDKSDDNITLRPEFTAGVVRAFISNGLSQYVPLKLFSYGPLFRYERPQKGRQRQFHQINFEVFGDAGYLSDIEMISLAYNLAGVLGIQDKLNLEINSLGDKESRAAYREALIAYYSKYKNDLSEDSKIRLTKNPLRILDSKDEGDKKINQGAPLLKEYYSDTAKQFFDNIVGALTNMGIEFSVNPYLVRGLDYYDHTCFEFTTTHLGSQNAVFAGGRYNNLVSQMGGPDTPAIGFAGGIERIMLLIEDSEMQLGERPVALIPIGDRAIAYAGNLAHQLRSQNISIELAYNGNVGKRIKKASDKSAKLAVIFGDTELDANKVKLKNLDSGKEDEVELNEIIKLLVNN